MILRSLRRVFGIALALAFGTLCPRVASGEPLPGCEGCVLFPVPTPVSSSPGPPSPLLVVLHGDIDHASTTAARWTVAAKAHGVVLLGIECPRSLGCDRGSFWRWNGAPAYLEKQVDAVRARYSIDARRVFLSGWSGGASYMGWHATDLPKIFAALVHHGGGVAPNRTRCPSTRTPVYFLVGAQNPLHGLAKELRDYYTRCGHEVKWDLVPNAGHPEELAALDPRKAGQVLDWLLARPSHDASDVDDGGMEAEAPVRDAGSADTGADRLEATTSDAGATARVLDPADEGRGRVPPKGRGCAVGGRPEASFCWVAAATALLVFARTSRRRTGVSGRSFASGSPPCRRPSS